MVSGTFPDTGNANILPVILIALFKRQLDCYWEQIGYGFEQRSRV